ncbi:unnamed protein product [Macrosiphum euphorbiae]|nr:unnamed protein product [Macrosiphum euphorbiae]
MLKTTINMKHNINIGTYPKLQAFLKRKSTGFKSKKSKVLTSTDIKKFIDEAPNIQYLVTKVVLIFGITGACRREELSNITINDIQDFGSMLHIKLPYTKTNCSRSFTIEGEFYDIFKKYIDLRPANVQSDRFFLNYKNGKCTKQVIGKNKIGNMPKEIANYLNLPDPQAYTGHSFRRTSATLLADSGGDITTLKRHGGWKSSQIAEGYIEDSINNKKKIFNQITESITNPSSTQTTNDVNYGASTSKASDVDEKKKKQVSAEMFSI